jgi:hypothetical protein
LDNFKRKLVNSLEKPKKRVFSIRLGFIVFLVFMAGWAVGQEIKLENQSLPPIPFRDSLNVDLNRLLSDTTSRADTTKLSGRMALKTDSIGDIKTTIHYKAKDSILMDVVKNIAYLYGEAEIDYGPIELKAAYIELDYVNNILYATGLPDSTGKLIGKPVFKEGIETYETKTLRYNFKTGKAYITGAVTQQGEGILQAEKIRKSQTGELYTYFGRYTTCNLEHPHFHIQSEMIKAIPGNKLISGPFHLRFNDIPTPIGFAFGMFPDQQKRRSSGVIFPNYGEERVRGFFIRDGGYYMAFNDMVHTSLMGEIYSKGGWGFTTLTQYKKRYAYSGNFRFNYNRFTSDLTEIRPLAINDFWVDWSHRPETKGSSRFSASVKAGTSTYNNNNNINFERNVNSEFASSVQYQKTFVGTPFNMSASLRHSQNVRDGRVNLTLPEASFNMNRQTPFESMQFELLKRLNFAWNFNVANRINNRPVQAAPQGIKLANPSPIAADSILGFNFETLPFLLRNGASGGKHSIPISTSFNVLKHINVSPSFNYEELWYLQELKYTYVPELEAVRMDTLNGFSRAGTYSASIGATSRIYGTMYFQKGKLQALRHMVTPGVSFSYRPDYGLGRYGFFQDVQVNENGDRRMLSKYEGFAFGAPQMGQSAALSFQLDNNLEGKMLRQKDTATVAEKIKILDNFGLSTSYNFLADSFKLSVVRFTIRTSILNNNVQVNFGGDIDPYAVQTDSLGEGMVRMRRVDKFSWNSGQGLGSLNNFQIALSTNLNPAAKGKETQGPMVGRTGGLSPGGDFIGIDGARQLADQTGDEAYARIAMNPYQYVDFTIPWNLNISYNIAYRRVNFLDSDVTQSLTFQGDVSITEKWKIGFNSGYDFEMKDLTHTTININRDLHCWVLRVNWVPFGRFTSYSVDLQVKSSLLQDLKLSRRRNLNDR